MSVCVLCQTAEAEDLHHPTGRIDGRYVDPDFVVPVCHDCHELAGDDLRAEGLERGVTASTTVEAVAHCLDCLGVFCARLANSDPSSLAATIGRRLRRYARDLRAEVQQP